MTFFMKVATPLQVLTSLVEKVFVKRLTHVNFIPSFHLALLFQMGAELNSRDHVDNDNHRRRNETSGHGYNDDERLAEFTRANVVVDNIVRESGCVACRVKGRNLDDLLGEQVGRPEDGREYEQNDCRHSVVGQGTKLFVHQDAESEERYKNLYADREYSKDTFRNSSTLMVLISSICLSESFKFDVTFDINIENPEIHLGQVSSVQYTELTAAFGEHQATDEQIDEI